MKRKFLAIIAAVILCLTAFTACDIGLKDKEYNPTESIYFDFTLRADGETYAISKKEGATLPETIKLPAEYVSPYGETFPVVEVKAEGFNGDENLKSVIIPTGYTVIGMHSFYGCRNLNTLSIGISHGRDTTEGLVIKLGAFQECSALVSVTLGSCIKVVGDFAFCATKISSVTLSRVESVGYMAFADCAALSKFYIPSTLVDIDADAFKGSLNVKFSIATTNKKYKVENNQIVEK